MRQARLHSERLCEQACWTVTADLVHTSLLSSWLELSREPPVNTSAAGVAVVPYSATRLACERGEKIAKAGWLSTWKVYPSTERRTVLVNTDWAESKPATKYTAACPTVASEAAEKPLSCLGKVGLSTVVKPGDNELNTRLTSTPLSGLEVE